MATCFLYTAAYPFGNGESFIEQDLEIIAQHFDDVVVIPYSHQGDPRLISYDNVRVELLYPSNHKIGLFTTLKHVFKSSTGPLLKTIGNMRSIGAHFKSIVKNKPGLEKLIVKAPENTVHFSYWMSEWAILLGQLKTEKKISRFVCRGHGYDVFHFRRSAGFIPFQKFIIDRADHVILSSLHARDYLTDLFSYAKQKIKTIHLNPVLHEHLTNSPSGSTTLHFLSVSNTVAIKKIEDIPPFLAQIPAHFKVTWTHIGNGNKQALISQMAQRLPKHIDVNLKGHLSPKAIAHFYQNTPLTAFIHCSASEGGVPLAIQEAYSHGLPIICRYNGGVNEIKDCHPATFDFDKTINDQQFLSLNTNDRAKIKANYYKHFNRSSSQKALISLLKH